MNVVGDPNRRDGGSLDKSIQEHFAASPVGDLIPIKAREKIVGLVDDDDRPSRYAADRVGDQERCDPVASIGLKIFLVGLSAKLDREADAGAERLGEFGFACSRGTVEEEVNAPVGPAPEIPDASDDPNCEIA
jgi:hypothetical protein